MTAEENYILHIETVYKAKEFIYYQLTHNAGKILNIERSIPTITEDQVA